MNIDRLVLEGRREQCPRGGRVMVVAVLVRWSLTATVGEVKAARCLKKQ
jgi:hypothetical protein